MKVQILGCSGGIASGRRTTSLLVNDHILIDGGTGLGDLAQAQISDIRHLFLSHSHLDHIAGLPFLLDPLLRDPGATGVTLYAQPETLDALQRHVFNGVLWPDLAALPDGGAPVLRYHAMQPGQCCTVEGVDIRMIGVNHTVPTAGFHLQAGSASVGFSGDTTTNTALWQALNEAESLDLLVVEAAFPDEEEALSRASKHYCPGSLASDIKQLRHRPLTVLSHAKPGFEDVILQQCRAAMPDRDVRALSAGDCFTL